MSTVVATFVVFSLAVAAMAVGIIFGRAPIRGSCGGVSGKGCAACAGRCTRSDVADNDDAAGEKDAC